MSLSPQEWMEKLKKDEALLRGFVREWHPASKGIVRRDSPDLSVTAPGPEQVAIAIREQIAQTEKLDPTVRWDRAVKTDNVIVLYNLLQNAWFGVPESTGCWRLAGFSEAVDLLDEPPESEE